MRVTVTYQGQVIQENELDMPLSPSTVEHFLYAIRLRELREGYYEEFNFFALPLPIWTVAAGATVIGEARVSVPIGTFDCWEIQMSGGWNAHLWVSKDERIVVKFVEDNLAYILREIRYWR